MTTATDLPVRIQAHLHPDAIDRVTRFYDASTDDTLLEIFQNSRRAGATRIEVTIANGVLDITDDGAGISDPHALLAFGQANWPDDTMQQEDPAGMGFFCLSRYPYAAVRSRHRDSDTAWHVLLHPDNFLGRSSAPVLPCPEAGPTGTTVTIPDREAKPDHVALAARYLPIPVICNGEPTSQQAFLHDAVYTETWEGIRIGVYHRFHTNADMRILRGEINFHGVIAQGAKLPQVRDLNQHTWYAAVDVDHNPNLELVLPARRQVVQTPFLQELRQAAHQVIYRAILNEAKPVDLPYAEYVQAHHLGVPVPEARPRLHAWSAETADYYLRPYHHRASEPLPEAPVIIPADLLEPCDQQTLHLAAFEHDQADAFVKEEPSLRGYAWYDAIPVADGLRITVTDGDAQHTLRDYDGARNPKSDGLVDEITFDLRARDSTGATRLVSCHGSVAFNLLTSEVHYTRNPQPLVARDGRTGVSDLTELMLEAYFQLSDAAESDSAETQMERWEEEYSNIATALLQSPEDAIKDSVALALRRYVTHHIHPGYTVTVTMSSGQRPEVNVSKTNEAGP